MRTKRKGNKLLDANIISPDAVYATFNDDLCSKTKDEIVLFINYGSEMLSIYKQHRDSLHIVNVVEMLKKMEEVFHEFDEKKKGK